MVQDDFDPKLGRIRDARRARAERHATKSYGPSAFQLRQGALPWVPLPIVPIDRPVC